MRENKYLQWLVKNTSTAWWHDSADPDEIDESLENGAVGVTTNPVLISKSLYSRPNVWEPLLADMPKELKGSEKAEEILKRITQSLAAKLEPFYNNTKGMQGYVCAQVNPAQSTNADAMILMAKRLSKWASNIAVKLPVTAAGLEALEECVAEGITITATVGFTVPQAIAVAQRYEKGRKRAEKTGINPGRCFAVIMVGRLDDYLRDVAMDRNAHVLESDLTQAGTAAVKRVYSIFRKENYKAILLPAGMRGEYHATELAGGDMVLSIHPKIQAKIEKVEGPWEERINIPVDKDVIKRLSTISEFLRAYEPDGMKPEEFITYGAVQRTLTQFSETGWTPIEAYNLK